MAARTPRKMFASSFVVTVASTACVTTSSPPPEPARPQPVTTTPTQPTEPTEPTQPTQPTEPGGAAPAGTYAFDQRWTVMKSGQTCSAHANVECPKPKKGEPMMTCNPPPPMKIECPSGWDGTNALTVVKYANQTECMVEPPPVKCPPNVACNPPPPRKTACPTH